MRVALLLFILLLIAGVIVVALMMVSSGKTSGSSGGKVSVFGVHTIAVEGAKTYTSDQIVKISGITVGQNVFTISKTNAARKILNSCPYVETVKVASPAFDKIKITVSEATAVGVVPVDGSYIVISEKGKGLEKLAADSKRLSGYRIIKTAVKKSSGVGSSMLEDRNLNIITTLISAMDASGLKNITEMDLTDTSDICLRWKNQITICLGNDSNLPHEIRTAKTTLERVLKERGEDCKGQLDLSSYSDTDSSNDEIVFTPEELLNTTSKTGSINSGGTTKTAA